MRKAAFYLSAIITGLAAAHVTRGDTDVATPLHELQLSGDTYRGYIGGLYGDHHWTHQRVGLFRDELRSASPLGVCFLGMSNASIVGDAFVEKFEDDPAMRDAVVLVNGPICGDVFEMADDKNQCWDRVRGSIRARGIEPGDVKIVLIKQAMKRPAEEKGFTPDSFPEHPLALKDAYVKLLQRLHVELPEVKLALMVSRQTGYYAQSTLNPEPYAYWNAWAIKWLIDQQGALDPEMAFHPLQGQVKMPVLAWGVYSWNDGPTPWSHFNALSAPRTAEHFRQDGTHPSEMGAELWANLAYLQLRLNPCAAEFLFK